jgi:hypothetical protein
MTSHPPLPFATCKDAANQLPNSFMLCVEWSAVSSCSDWRYEKLGHPPRAMIVYCVSQVLSIFINVVKSGMNLKNDGCLA